MSTSCYYCVFCIIVEVLPTKVCYMAITSVCETKLITTLSHDMSIVLPKDRETVDLCTPYGMATVYTIVSRTALILVPAKTKFLIKGKSGETTRVKYISFTLTILNCNE